tara:strand:+ start:27 stop:881 length:855 start_codon:yes stop_codon:yes gene_type:complete
MKKLSRFLKILGWSFLIIFILGYVSFYFFTKPISDEAVLNKFKEFEIKPRLTSEIFKEYRFRKLTFINNDTLPTMVFVHGTIGSSTDFIGYIVDSVLSKKANFISYDRVGYNYHDKHETQASIAFEEYLLQYVTKDLNKSKTIIVGYSYGGPIALATKDMFKKIILVAPAVFSEVEPDFWFTNIYKWKFTRWLIPEVWKQAGKEKLTHKEDLRKFEDDWTQNKNKILGIHGTKDIIVPFTNSKYLEEKFPENQFELIKIPNANHYLIWTEFEQIREQFLNALEE